MPQLVHVNDTHASEPYISAENKVFIPILLHLMSKIVVLLNTLNYVEFDTLCALSILEEKFKCVDLPWLSRCIGHLIGKYNCKEECMVHWVYICSHWNSVFVMRDCDRLEGCHKTNIFTCFSSSFVFKKQITSKKGSIVG
jgi:hypothetical protein